MTMKINPSDLPFGDVQGPGAPDQLQEQTVVQGAQEPSPLSTQTDETEVGAVHSQLSNVAHSTRAGLTEIASRTNLSNPSEVEAALKESAHLLIESRLGDQRDTPEAAGMIETLSDQIIHDPLLRTRFLRILSKIKPA